VFFHGFDCQYFYDQTKIRPVDKFFDGTACQNADIKGAGGDPTIGEYRVEVLSNSSLDTSNPILFQVRYSIKGGFTDSAMIAPSLFDALHDTTVPNDSQIDTVIIDNASGRDNIGWYPFGLVFMDTTKPPPPPKKISVALSSDSLDIQADSLRTLSLNISSLDSANLKTAIFEFDIDTNVYDLVSILKASLLTNGTLSVSKDTTHITVQFAGVDTTKAGELLQIVLRGKNRVDTLCSELLRPKLTVVNTDNLVSSVVYNLGGICVLGKARKDTILNGVKETGAGKYLVISPYPASSYVNFHLLHEGGVQKHLIVFDALGRKVLDQMFDSDFHWEVYSMPPGFYTATVMDNTSLLMGSIRPESIKILIVH